MSESSLRYYWGLAKEAVKGTAVAPVTFPRWLDGAMLSPKISSERVLEGDGGRDAAFTLKKLQEWTPALITYPRPIECGQLIAAAFGTACDGTVGSTPTNSTTLSAGVAAGVTSITTVATFAPASIIQIDVGGLAEVRTVTSVTGAGPFTVNFATALARGHLSGVAVANVVAPYTHTLTPQQVPDYFSVEAGVLTADLIARIADCIVDELDIEGGAGTPIKVTLKWQGITGTRQSAAATVVSEAGLPFFFASGTFSVDGAGVTSVTKFKLTYKNTIDKPQAAAVTVYDLIWGRRTLDVEYSIVFATDALYRKMFFGGPTGTTDSAVVGNGALDFTFLQGGLVGAAYTMELQVPSIDYYAAEPTAKLAGNAMVYDVKGYATHGASPLITALLINAYQPNY